MHRVLMEKMSLKRVSVVLCTYNGEKYIREQLESIVSQTYPIHELLIQDDCSTDATPLIIEEYKEKYPFIRYQDRGLGWLYRKLSDGLCGFCEFLR